MTLQQQLSIEIGDDSFNEAFSRRLSRVVTKLFGRVLKAEESSPNAYTSLSLDFEVLLCSMEDVLNGCKEIEESGASADACIEMVRSLVQSIITTHGDASALKEHMADLGIDPFSSALGMLLDSCDVLSEDEDLLLDAAPEPPKSVRNNSASTPNRLPSRDLSTLVSAVAKASQGPERTKAVEALRRYRDMHGDEELNAHLGQVSSPFRVFIEEQLGCDPSPQKENSSYAAGTMSERLRSLRSRLQANDATIQPVQPAVSDLSGDDDAEFAARAQNDAPTSITISSPSNRNSKIAQPSPSKLSQPSAPRVSKPVVGTSSQMLRERLAAAQGNRSVVAANATSSGNSVASDSSSTSASLSRAAALRARLEAVKNKK
jgi:hypothetical protein